MADGVPELDDKILSDFLSWCGTNGLILSDKVRVGLQGSCHRYGMVATDNIEKEECLFEIPRSLLLQPNTSSISEILETLTNEDQLASERGSGWAPLLLALMYEYTNPTSHWKPYLNLVPDVTVLDQPMFWGKEERQRELDGTGIEDDVESDIHRIEEEYNTIVLPFIKKHKQYFSESCHTVDLYKHMAAFVMAYSFTEQKPATDNDDDDDDDNDDDDDDDDTNDAAPAMVPMADILNHITNNNAHLEFGAKTLSMVATQNIFKGQEIFNTYGKLGNCHLLQSYGFVEDELPNPYDMVEVPISSFCEVMKSCQPPKETRFVDAKFKFLEEMGVASEDDIFLFGREGCSQFGPDLYATLRILHLSEVQFKKLLEEQLQIERSNEFDDIRQVLDQQDEDSRKDSSWRILELIFNSENKNKKKRRRVDDEKSEENKKSRKELLASGDCNLDVVSENNSLSKNDSKNGSVNGLAESGILKKDMILSTNKAVIRPAVEGNLTESKTENVTNCKSTKNGRAKEGLESCNRERAGNGHVVKNVRGDNDVDEVDDDVDDDDDDDGDTDAADDDGCGGGDGDDDDDDDDDEDDDDDDDDSNGAKEEQQDEVEEEVDEEESEQPLTYGRIIVTVANRMEKDTKTCGRVMYKETLWTRQYGFGLPRRKAAK